MGTAAFLSADCVARTAGAIGFLASGGAQYSPLELARAEAGQIEVEPVPTDIAELVLETVEDFRAHASAAGLALDVRAGDALSTQTDPTRVRQVPGNLLSNAVKYTPKAESR